MNIPSLDFGLGEDINLLRDAVQAFADAEIAPRAAEIDRVNEFPADLWKKFGDMGLLGMTAGEEYGGTEHGLPGAHRRAGRNLPRLGLGRPVLRCPLEPVRQPDPPQRQRSAEARNTCPS
jgi:alkylation response protein AidB-like acyl-CoA dehydrogenase